MRVRARVVSLDCHVAGRDVRADGKHAVVVVRDDKRAGRPRDELSVTLHDTNPRQAVVAWRDLKLNVHDRVVLSNPRHAHRSSSKRAGRNGERDVIYPGRHISPSQTCVNRSRDLSGDDVDIDAVLAQNAEMIQYIRLGLTRQQRDLTQDVTAILNLYYCRASQCRSQLNLGEIRHANRADRDRIDRYRAVSRYGDPGVCLRVSSSSSSVDRILDYGHAVLKLEVVSIRRCCRTLERNRPRDVIRAGAQT